MFELIKDILDKMLSQGFMLGVCVEWLVMRGRGDRGPGALKDVPVRDSSPSGCVAKAQGL